MKKILLNLLFLIFCLPLELYGEWQATVVSVYDGDTLIVSREGRAEIIRLYGVDCPEKEQHFGLKSKEFTSALVSGKKVRVIPVDTARYDLCKVFIGETCLNKKLLRAGYAWCYKEYSIEREWALLEQRARSKRKGLWTQEDPLPPWEYRKAEANPTTRRSHTIKMHSKHRTGTVMPEKRSSKGSFQRYRKRRK